MHWKGRAISIILCLIGAAVSWHLFEIHLAVKYGEYAGGGVCDISEAVRCDVAAASDWSTFLNMPIAAWGFGYYAFLTIALTIQKLLPESSQRRLSTLMVILISVSVAYSILLFLVSEFILGALCPFCVGLYIVNILTFLVLPLTLEYPGFFAMLKSAALNFVSGVFSVSTAAFMGIMVYSLVAFQLYTDQWIRNFQGERYDLGVDLAAEKGHEDSVEEALVEIFIFSDFQCPFCWNAHKSLEHLVDEFGESIVHVHFVHFPLDKECNPRFKDRKNLHPNACYASRVAFAAKKQGKMENIINPLFESIDRPKNERTHELYDRIAAQAELDMEQFYADMAGDELHRLLDADVKRGLEVDVQKTPTLFVNGRRLVGFPGETALRRIITNEIELKTSEKAPESFEPMQPLTPLPDFSPDCWGQPIGELDEGATEPSR